MSEHFLKERVLILIRKSLISGRKENFSYSSDTTQLQGSVANLSVTIQLMLHDFNTSQVCQNLTQTENVLVF